MDAGGTGWVLIDIVGVLLLGAVLLWVVLRVRSKGKATTPPETERGTERVYAEEERRRRAGTDDE